MAKGPNLKIKPMKNVDFSDTQVAFAHLEDSELRKAFLLFKMLSYPSLVKLGPILAGLSLKLRLPIRRLVKNTMFGQFCGGEDIEECRSTIQNLAHSGIGTILDFATEACRNEEDFERVKQEVKHTIELAQMERDVPFAVFKPTGLGRINLLEKRDRKLELSDAEKEEFKVVARRFEEICEYAFQHNVRVLVDAEESWIQDSVDQLVRDMMVKFNKERPIVYNTIQLYRKDRLDFLKSCYGDASAYGYHLGVKLVRGAYLEKEASHAKDLRVANPIHASKEATDQDYNLAIRFCIENIQIISLVAGTHNEKSTKLLMSLMHEFGVANHDPRVYYAQLLGMSDNLSYQLAKNGYNVCKYVPYGRLEELLPYLSRRAEENSSIQGQSGRELSLIQQELNRRSVQS
ncbi:proline dehydrogenase family protein [Pseudobacteriovorax antillogorgiicola]|uniref:L-proline dehydrogenase n=1 Tax=Pseudobacteriovorax antillogorgiicola TaxID=1513793 RepID=A0A1Y6CBG2_9BACT|nr:proline dehydrogenase family protein [Pseudobacteriovorax antillogorgiicola]TCS49414.1 L-proline dehydrogenase [Pseudobacteriovorax antillogorgiicola]SMF46923.1 L-proline dehydrogenase [Pseudobacteriovorax antillogorgiicola]